MKPFKNTLLLWFILLIFVLILGVIYCNQVESYMPQPNPILPKGPYALSMVVSDPAHSATNKLVTVSTDGTVIINPTIGPFPVFSRQGFENQKSGFFSNPFQWFSQGKSKEGLVSGTVSTLITPDFVTANGVSYNNPLLFLPPFYNDKNTIHNFYGTNLVYIAAMKSYFFSKIISLSQVSTMLNYYYNNVVLKPSWASYIISSASNTIITNNNAILTQSANGPEAFFNAVDTEYSKTNILSSTPKLPPGWNYIRNVFNTEIANQYHIYEVCAVDSNGNTIFNNNPELLNDTPGTLLNVLEYYAFDISTNTWFFINDPKNISNFSLGTAVSTPTDSFNNYVPTSSIITPSTTIPVTTKNVIQSGPATATISTFIIDHFNVNPNWMGSGMSSTSAPTSIPTSTPFSAISSSNTPKPFQPYVVSTTITFNLSGIGFSTYDIWMNNGSTNSNNVGSNSQFTCVTGACSTCSILPNCSTKTISTANVTNPTNPATTKPTTSITSTPGPTSIPTASTYTNTKQSVTSVSVTLNENLYYTIWLILYDINGNVITSTCPNTVIQILPSMVNNPSMYLNYTFSYSYFLIGGGGGGGQGGSLGNGTCGHSGQIVVSNRGTIAQPGYVMVLVNQVVQTKPITGQNATFIYTFDSNNNLNIMGGKGGSATTNTLGQGANGMAGADAKIACTDVDQFPIVAKGGQGGQGGNSISNSGVVCQSSNGDIDGRGEGGSGGNPPNGKGGDGYMGYENINIYYFLVTGGTNPNNPPTIGPTPCAVAVCKSCAEVGGGSSNLMGYNISQTGEIQFASPLSFIIDPFSSSSSLFNTLSPSLLSSSVKLDSITSDTVITVQSNSDQSSITISVIPNKIPNIIPLPEFSSYSAWQFQFTMNNSNITISPTQSLSTPYGSDPATVLNNIAAQNQYQQNINDNINAPTSVPTTMQRGLPVSIQTKFSLSNSIQILNKNTLQYMSNTPSARSIQIYPSDDFLNSPNSYPVSYNPAFIYQKNDSTHANGRIWTPANIYETYVPSNGEKNVTIYLGVWYIYMDNTGLFKGFYHDCQKSSVGTPITSDWEELNALQYKPGMTYTVYFFQTDGIISMFDIDGN